ncbi:hypothetical protein L596_008461 [Steinernema carpocapsae]|uniref:Uncharacterized protein n=1 Tax=Steinernema carpocapsae TaxID=34508 RepID=A0A4U5PDM4_STECR|nr:hypothetical protein L596_008461 [Steinernema carpocapsae]
MPPEPLTPWRTCERPWSRHRTSFPMDKRTVIGILNKCTNNSSKLFTDEVTRIMIGGGHRYEFFKASVIWQTMLNPQLARPFVHLLDAGYMNVISVMGFNHQMPSGLDMLALLNVLARNDFHMIHTDIDLEQEKTAKQRMVGFLRFISEMQKVYLFYELEHAENLIRALDNRCIDTDQAVLDCRSVRFVRRWLRTWASKVQRRYLRFEEGYHDDKDNYAQRKRLPKWKQRDRMRARQQFYVNRIVPGKIIVGELYPLIGELRGNHMELMVLVTDAIIRGPPIAPKIMIPICKEFTRHPIGGRFAFDVKDVVSYVFLSTVQGAVMVRYKKPPQMVRVLHEGVMKAIRMMACLRDHRMITRSRFREPEMEDFEMMLSMWKKAANEESLYFKYDYAVKFMERILEDLVKGKLSQSDQSYDDSEENFGSYQVYKTLVREK